MADKMREESDIHFVKGLRKGLEDDMVEHLLAWAQCQLIPMYTSRNKRVFESCSFRPDIVWSLLDVCIMLECDAYAHDNYDKKKELDRMQELMDTAAAEGFRHTVLIRFNPSLQGTTSHFKFASLLVALMNVFARKPEYIGAGRAVIHLFYPDIARVWYPAEALATLVGNSSCPSII